MCPIPEFVVELLDGAGGIALAGHIEEARSAADASIDESDVQATETVDHVCDRFLHRGEISYVHFLRHHIRRHGREPFLCLLELGGVAVENTHLGAVVGEHFRAGIADTARPAGDERDLSIDAEKLGYFHLTLALLPDYTTPTP